MGTKKKTETLKIDFADGTSETVAVPTMDAALDDDRAFLGALPDGMLQMFGITKADLLASHDAMAASVRAGDAKEDE